MNVPRTPRTAKAAAQAIVAINSRWGRPTPEHIRAIADADLKDIRLRPSPGGKAQN